MAKGVFIFFLWLSSKVEFLWRQYTRTYIWTDRVTCQNSDFDGSKKILFRWNIKWRILYLYFATKIDCLLSHNLNQACKECHRLQPTIAHWSERPNLIHFLFLMKYCLDIISKHTTGLLRCQGFQEKYKRPTKVVKAKPKAREPKKWNF